MYYLEQFLTPDEAQQLTCWLAESDAVSWQQETFQMFGRRGVVPRWLAWCGDTGLNYRYTGLDHRAHGWPAQLAQLRDRVNTCSRRWQDLSANFLLLNRYDHGAHHMGWHKDDEQGTAPYIASISLGGVRRFRIRTAHEGTRSFDLASGSLLMFDGRQAHTLTKTRRQVAPRINLTFRHIHAAD